MSLEIKDLDKIKAVIGEQYDSYLIVVAKDGQTAHVYSSKLTAYGMAKMVSQDIEIDWQYQREDQLTQEEDEDDNES